MSIPSHSQAQVIFNHIDQVETKNGKVTTSEMKKVIAEVGKLLAGMGKNFDPTLLEGIQTHIMKFMEEHKGVVNEEAGINGLQSGI